MTRFTSIISANRTARYLFAAIIGFGLLHTIGLLLTHIIPNEALQIGFRLFDLTHERNLPTLFSVGLLLLNAALFLIVQRNSRTFRERHIAWPLLSGTFAYLSLDEFSGFHEAISQPLRQLFNTSGILYHAWLIPYSILATIVAAIALPHLWKIRPSLRKWFFLAAIIYITGAIGCKSLTSLFPNPSLLYHSLATLKELCEMSGLATLAYSLLRLIEQQYGGFNLIIPNVHPIHAHHPAQPYTAYQSPINQTLEFSLTPEAATHTDR
jgi:hypothetical protein